MSLLCSVLAGTEALSGSLRCAGKGLHVTLVVFRMSPAFNTKGMRVWHFGGWCPGLTGFLLLARFCHLV
jgi:hypothetical protein